MIVRNKKGEDYSIELFFSLHGFIKLDDIPYSNRYTVGILSVGNIKRYIAALNFVGKEWKIHSVNYNKK